MADKVGANWSRKTHVVERRIEVPEKPTRGPRGYYAPPPKARVPNARFSIESVELTREDSFYANAVEKWIEGQ